MDKAEEAKKLQNRISDIIYANATCIDFADPQKVWQDIDKEIQDFLQQYAREREVELINFLKKSHPYPKNIFIPPTNEQWKKFHKTLRDAEISGDGFAGAAARMGYDACIYIIESNQEGE